MKNIGEIIVFEATIAIALEAVRLEIQLETMIDSEERYVPIESPVFHIFRWDSKWTSYCVKLLHGNLTSIVSSCN